MKTFALILVAGFIACPLSGIAQLTPLFQFTIYFEDSMNNHDSIVLGYDPSASSQYIDPQFGEIVLNGSFDSVFEVRAVHFLDDSYKTLKTVIVQDDTLINCVHILGAIILIQAKLTPVKISYDYTLFPEDACGNVILTRDWDIFFWKIGRMYVTSIVCLIHLFT